MCKISGGPLQLLFDESEYFYLHFLSFAILSLLWKAKWKVWIHKESAVFLFSRWSFILCLQTEHRLIFKISPKLLPQLHFSLLILLKGTFACFCVCVHILFTNVFCEASYCRCACHDGWDWWRAGHALKAFLITASLRQQQDLQAPLDSQMRSNTELNSLYLRALLNNTSCQTVQLDGFTSELR